MSLSANANGSFSGGTLFYWALGGLCQYSLRVVDSGFTISGLAGTGSVVWGNSITEPTDCVPSAFTDYFAFVLSGSPSSGASANTVQITDVFDPSYECTQK